MRSRSHYVSYQLHNCIVLCSGTYLGSIKYSLEIRATWYKYDLSMILYLGELLGEYGIIHNMSCDPYTLEIINADEKRSRFCEIFLTSRAPGFRSSPYLEYSRVKSFTESSGMGHNSAM